MHLLSVLGALHRASQHAQRGLEGHRLRIVFMHLCRGLRACNSRILDEASVWNFSLDVDVHRAVHDDDHRGRFTDHELIVIHYQWPIWNDFKMTLHIGCSSSDRDERSTLSRLSGHPLTQFQDNSQAFT